MADTVGGLNAAEVMPLFVGGRPVLGRGVLSVPDRFTGAQAFRVALADAGMIDGAAAAACAVGLEGGMLLILDMGGAS